jgi:hypothetical protein
MDRPLQPLAWAPGCPFASAFPWNPVCAFGFPLPRLLVVPQATGLRVTPPRRSFGCAGSRCPGYPVLRTSASPSAGSGCPVPASSPHLTRSRVAPVPASPACRRFRLRVAPKVVSFGVSLSPCCGLPRCRLFGYASRCAFGLPRVRIFRPGWRSFRVAPVLPPSGVPVASPRVSPVHPSSGLACGVNFRVAPALPLRLRRCRSRFSRFPRVGARSALPRADLQVALNLCITARRLRFLELPRLRACGWVRHESHAGCELCIPGLRRG